MEIKTGRHSGFCFGVRRAVDEVEALLKQNIRVYTLGEIIHNRAVVENLASRGATVANTPEEIPAGSTVVIRSHGVAPDVIERCKAAGLEIKDATCPFVARIHNIVAREAETGADVIIVGDENHPEVKSIKARAGERAFVASDESDLSTLQKRTGAAARAVVVAQTTISRVQFEKVINSLKTFYGEVAVYDTICTTTANRQRETEELAKTSDAVVVIGGAHSSNTRKLAEIAKTHCSNVFCIENAKETASILAKLRAHGIISVVAGASTPNWMILEVLTSMNELEKTAIAPEEEAVVSADVADVTIDTAEAVAEAIVNDESPVTVDAPAEVVAEKSDADVFTEAFEKTLVRIRNGQILTGTVVQIADGEVCVNIGYKSDGFIPKSEFSFDNDVNPADMVKVGDEIEVEVLKVNDGEGNVLLSHKSVESKKAWERFAEAAGDENTVYDAVGKEVVKGGIIASINGIRAFVPASQASIRYVEKLDQFVGQPMRLMLIEVDDKKKRVVASQKKVMMAEAEEKKRAIWSTLEVGSKVSGVVRRLTDFGAFVDIGGVDGLVHVTEVAWGRVKHPSDVLKVGQEIEVLILSVDQEKGRISLSYKQCQPKPWTTAAERYPIGATIEGKVVRIVPFGAFVALEPTIDGLIHISQVATTRIAKVEDELKVGDIVRAKVLDVNPEAKRISLSRREVLLEEMPPIEEIMMDDSETEATVEDENTVVIPPVESASTSLADLFPKLEDDE